MPKIGLGAPKTTWFVACSYMRAPAERMTFEKAIQRYIVEVTPTKRPETQTRESKRAQPLTSFFGRYSLAGITPDLVAQYRDMRLAGEDRKNEDGKAIPRAANTVRLELALLGHLFTVAVKEWGLGLIYRRTKNPVRRCNFCSATRNSSRPFAISASCAKGSAKEMPLWSMRIGSGVR